MAFRVGQRVVCIVDFAKADDLRGVVSYPQEGEVCTIRDIVQGSTGSTCLHLQEHQNPTMKCVDGVKERAFDAEHFRPVVDISDLEAIVREQMLGKPRHIAPDKFDRKRVEV